VAVDNNGSILASGRSDRSGLLAVREPDSVFPHRRTERPAAAQCPLRASCASVSLCALVGSGGRSFTSTDPFSPPDVRPPRKSRKRPRTILVFAEHFWKHSFTRRHQAPRPGRLRSRM
jgi:hypothetical protein